VGGLANFNENLLSLFGPPVDLGGISGNQNTNIQQKRRTGFSGMQNNGQRGSATSIFESVCNNPE
jgi:hypothetical protein